jgi:CRP-like cAMP-binding protein
VTDPTPGTNLFKHDPSGAAHPAGAVLFNAGEQGHQMFVVQSGEVELTIEGEVVERLGPGGIFGEMALVDPQHVRAGTAVAVTDVMLVAIDERRFLYLCERSPFFPLEVMRAMAARLRRTTRELMKP